MLKRLELVAKTLLALAATVLLWRPGRARRARERLPSARRLLLVRVDNRLGEALLMTPLLDVLHGRYEVDVLVHAKMVRVLEGHPKVGRVLGLDRRWLALGAWSPGLSGVRTSRYDAIINCGNWEVPSVTQALVSRLAAGSGVVIGPRVGVGGHLMDVAVAPAVDTTSELQQRLHLLSPLGVEPAGATLSFRAPRVGVALQPLVAELAGTRSAVVNPGGRLDWRRVPPEVFAAACMALLRLGRAPLVTWGPGEEALARAVVAAAPGARLAPPTSVDELAALMQAAGLCVCNNTGPMHLSVAVKATTVALFLRMPVERWGYPTPPHRMVDLTPHLGSVAAMSAAVTAALESCLPQATSLAARS